MEQQCLLRPHWTYRHSMATAIASCLWRGLNCVQSRGPFNLQSATKSHKYLITEAVRAAKPEALGHRVWLDVYWSIAIDSMAYPLSLNTLFLSHFSPSWYSEWLLALFKLKTGDEPQGTLVLPARLTQGCRCRAKSQLPVLLAKPRL